MPRNKRICEVDKSRLYQCFLENKDYLVLAKSLNIKANSARSIVTTMSKRNGIVSLPSGGSTYRKVDDEMRDELERIYHEFPSMTVKNINATLRIRKPNKATVTDDCISKSLDGMFYTLKKVYLHPHPRNSDITKESRRDYASWFLTHTTGHFSVFVDEAGCNMWTQRTRGRSKIGLPAVRIVNGQRGQNLTTILATSNTGIIKSKTFFGGTTKIIFQEFINDLNLLLIDFKDVYIIMDNASCHMVVSNNPDHHIKHLPIYSPMLNPVEEAFSAWKYVVKASLESQQNRIMDFQSAAASGLSKVQWRSSILKEIVVESLNVISIEKCAAWYNHMLQNLPRCFNM